MIVTFDVCEENSNDHLFIGHFVACLAVLAVSLARMVIVNCEHRIDDVLCSSVEKF